MHGLKRDAAHEQARRHVIEGIGKRDFAQGAAFFERAIFEMFYRCREMYGFEGDAPFERILADELKVLGKYDFLQADACGERAHFDGLD